MKSLPRITSFKFALFAIAACIATGATAAPKIVKWVDETGVTHFGNSQPGAATGRPIPSVVPQHVSFAATSHAAPSGSLEQEQPPASHTSATSVAPGLHSFLHLPQ